MDALRALFLRRDRRVFVPPGKGGVSSVPWDFARGEASLLELGFVLARPLADALRALSHHESTAVFTQVREALATEVGAHRQHQPLFRAFPVQTPQVASKQYKERVLAWLQQHPEQPCLVCSETAPVKVLDPCGHLVCEACWGTSADSDCPVCRQRLDPQAPFVLPKAPKQAKQAPAPGLPLKLLHLGADSDVAAQQLVHQLLARQSPLSPQDRDDLSAVVLSYGLRALPWVPERIAVKETTAVVFGALLNACPSDRAAVLEAGASHLRTATDVLRLLAVLAEQDPGLTGRVAKFPSLPRGLRRGLLELLERQAPALLIEDLGRQRERWKRAGEVLHPFERHRRLPHVALGFAILRHTAVDPQSALGKTVLAAAEPLDCVEQVGDRLRFVGWASEVEAALRSGDLSGAITRCAQRPGELLRRFDHLLRRVIHEQPTLEPTLLEALSKAVRRAAGPLLLGVLSALRPRTRPFPKRVFFPKGELANVHSEPDTRPLLTPEAIARASAILADELLARAAAQPAVSEAVLDAGLRQLMLPLSERNAARALVNVPRGSVLPVPAGNRFRLFLHWCQQPPQRVDLDLSVALYDANWRYVGLCDYTNLRFGEAAAVHSGDFTDAPPPKGASEFLDLDLEALARAKAAHLVVVVFSFNSIPFDRLAEAFAGFMQRHGDQGEAFDPRAVLQRFDLQGEAKVAIPMTVDLARMQIRWLGLNMPPGCGFHSVRGYRGRLAHLGLDLEAYFGVGSRSTLWDAATLHAAARAPAVQVQRPSGEVARYERGPGEAARTFWTRIHGAGEPDSSGGQLECGVDPMFVAGVDDALVDPPTGSSVYALWWNRLSAGRVQRLAASDLLSGLTPRG